MTYGITGNTAKDTLWAPVAVLAQRLHDQGLRFCLHADVAQGLEARGLADATFCAEHATTDLAADADMLLSFGGDGTMLRSAHQVGPHETPILGINLGRLGFLTRVEISEVEDAIARLEADDYAVQDRMVLDVSVEGADPDVPRWALNDVVLAKSGSASMIAIEAEVDGRFLNTYWADGLIIATPTGSTAYSLSVGGPIIAPGSDVLLLAPIAPHTLTARPIIVPDEGAVTLRVSTRDHPYVLAVDGQSAVVEATDAAFTLRRAEHVVRLVTFPERDYFATIRDKLSWGRSQVF